ncbi:Phospholysine phosphohistidine inorganic pyrophosphate phosphatase-like 2, partial [Homarus americanus]
WKEVTVRCLCAAWRPLWPECVLQRDFEGFEELEEEAVVHEIVSLGNSMGLEVDDDDVEELVEEHSKELSTEELLELHKEENETLKRSLTSEESGEEDKEESRIIPAKDLKDAFFCWSKLSKLAEDYHPDVVVIMSGWLSEPIKGVLLDITGVLYESGEGFGTVIPGSVEAVERLREAGIPVRFVTNETCASRAAVVVKLRHHNFSLSEADVFSPVPAVISVLRERGLTPHTLVHP